MTAGPDGKPIVTWLTPYWDLWTAHVGAIAGGRLAKAITPARELLGEEACVRALRRYVLAPGIKNPEWFTRECRRWADAPDPDDGPCVTEEGTLTPAGKRAYGG